MLIGGSSRVIVLGDFNAQNEAWGCTKNNFSGESLDRFLADSPFFSWIMALVLLISAAINYKNIPDLSITNCNNFNIKWSIGDDLTRSDHLPIIIDFSNKYAYSLSNASNNNFRTQKRSKLYLKDFEELFPILPLFQSSKDPLQVWYEFIVDCSLKAGAILYNGLGNKKVYNKEILTTVLLKKLNSNSI